LGLAIFFPPQAEGEKQGIGGKPDRKIAKIKFVKSQGGFSVDFVEDISVGSGDEPFRAEDIPSPLGTMADGYLVAVKTDGGYPPAFPLPVV